MTDPEKRRPAWLVFGGGGVAILLVAGLSFLAGMRVGARPLPVARLEAAVGPTVPGVGSAGQTSQPPAETEMANAADDGTLFRELTAAGAKKGPARDPLKGLDELLTQSLIEWEVPGVAVAIVKDDAVVYAKGFGRRKAGEAAAVDDRTLFTIASISKSFTTALAAMLVDEEKIAWDDPIVKHLPDFQLYDPWVTREATFRDLFCHRVGLARNDDLWFNTKLERPEILGQLHEVKPSAGFRGRFSYHNLLYLAAGEALGQAAGKTWDESIQERIFAPLGMKDSTVSSGTLATSANAATGHDKVKGQLQAVPLVNIDNCAPATAITSNAADMAQWLRLQLADGIYEKRQLISVEALREMQAQQVVIPPSDPLSKMFPDKTTMSYGLGWIVQDYRGQVVVAHPGNINGMRALVAMIPDQRLGIVVLANRALTPMPMALMYNIFDRYQGPSTPDRIARRTKALKDLEGQFATDKESRGFYAKGNERLSKQRFDEAIGLFTEAIRLDPRYHEAYFARGIARRSKNDLDGALADYGRALEISPKSSAVYSDRALTKKMKGDLAGAVADATQALKLKPDFAAAHAIRGLARLQLGQADEAQSDFDACLRLQPGLKAMLEKELEALRRP